MTNSGAIFVHRQTWFKMHAGPLRSHSALPEAVGLKKETGVCESLVSEWDAWGQTWEKLCVCMGAHLHRWRIECRTTLSRVVGWGARSGLLTPWATMLFPVRGR